MYRLILMSILSVAGFASHGIAQPIEDELEMQVYKIGDLVASSPSFANDTAKWPGTTGVNQDGENSQASQIDAAGYGGGLGGGYGGGGMGGGGGGGMMNVPDTIPKYISPQMGMAMGGMGGGMGGVMMNSPAQDASLLRMGIDRTLHAELLQVIQSINYGQWDQMGGPFTLQTFGDSLIVNADADTHKKLAQLLEILRKQKNDEPSLKLEWVVTTAASLEGSADEELVKSSLASGLFISMDRQAVSGSAGTHQNYITGSAPVVGGELVGYMPTVTKLISGWVVELRPVLRDKSNGAPAAQINAVVSYSSPSQSPELIEHTPDVRIDRVSLKAVQLVGSSVCPQNEWKEVAAFEQNEQSDSESLPNTFKLFVRWNLTDATSEAK